MTLEQKSVLANGLLFQSDDLNLSQAGVELMDEMEVTVF
jgi:hypothetical protein